MRSPTLLSTFLLLALTTASPDPFASPLDFNNFSPAQNAQNLFRRQAVGSGGCQPNYYACGYRDSSGRDTGSCCSINSVCTLDNAGQVACCALGAFCTGTVTQPGSPSTRTVTDDGDGTAIIGGGPITTPPQPTITSPPTNPQGGYIDNPYYAFPILWSSDAPLGDQQQCASAYATCNAWYAACTGALQGQGGTGLTVDAPQGGITVQPGNGGLGVESATSICASLQSQGCPGNGATCGVGPQPSPTGFIVVNPGGGAGSVRAMGGMKMLAIAGVMAGVVAAL